jgi:hypothetical protein
VFKKVAAKGKDNGNCHHISKNVTLTPPTSKVIVYAMGSFSVTGCRITLHFLSFGLDENSFQSVRRTMVHVQHISRVLTTLRKKP